MVMRVVLFWNQTHCGCRQTYTVSADFQATCWKTEVGSRPVFWLVLLDKFGELQCHLLLANPDRDADEPTSVSLVADPLWTKTIQLVYYNFFSYFSKIIHRSIRSLWHTLFYMITNGNVHCNWLSHSFWYFFMKPDLFWGKNRENTIGVFSHVTSILSDTYR